MNQELVKLVYGPYRAPQTRPGKYLVCEWRGKVKVGEFSDAPIPWPMKGKYRSLILCADLVKAVQRESATAVAYHWGVCSQTVSKWREALGVERWTPGTARLSIYTITQSFTRERRLAVSRQRKGKAIYMSPAAKRRYRQRLRDAWTPRRRRMMAARLKSIMARIKVGPGGRLGGPLETDWKAHEDRLLGTKPDREVARELGRTRVAVTQRRQMLGIPGPEKRVWTREEERLLGTQADRDVAKILGRSLSSVRHQRRRKKIRSAIPPGRAWLPNEDRLLGTMPDVEVARRVKRSTAAVIARRDQLGISLKNPKFRLWSAREETLLGTATDREIARVLGRTEGAVRGETGGLGNRESGARAGPEVDGARTAIGWKAAG